MKEKISNFYHRHPILFEIIRFLIVGGCATLVDMFVMGVTMYLFEPEIYPTFFSAFYGGGSPSTIATIVGTGVGFTVGLIVNYILSIFFVFNEKGKSKSTYGFIIFTVLSLIGLGINLLGMYIGYDLLHINQWIVKSVMTLIVLIYNYVSKRLILFKKSKSNEQITKI